MFRPNLIGQLERKGARDVHSRITYAAAVDCPFGAIDLEGKAQKTSVRADSSASRGAADEVVTPHAKILVPAYVAIAIGDRFTFAGIKYEILGTHERHAVSGRHDHTECLMTVMP